MKYFLAFIFILTFSSAQGAYVTVPKSTRDITNAEIREALEAHYRALSANEQWGVGMGCTLGRMSRVVDQAQTLRIDADKGIILAQVQAHSNIIYGPTRDDMFIYFSPETQIISKVVIQSISEDGLKRSCSTRNPLIKMPNLENLLQF